MESNTTKVLRSVAVSLAPDEVTKIIKNYLEKEGFEVRNVDFKMTKQVKDCGVGGEYEVLNFNGCMVSCRITTERTED